MNKKITSVVLLLSMGMVSGFAETKSTLMNGEKLPFYVYRDYKAKDNHFTPSGWMGDYQDLKVNDHWAEGSQPGEKSIRIDYVAKGSQGNGWTGIYWQNPPNNWGDKQGGYNLNGAQKVLFMAKGEKGDETVEFKMGGIGGAFSDSASATTGPIKLTKSWKVYSIPLDGLELSSISGGFCWTATKADNPNGLTLYVDNIRYE